MNHLTQAVSFPVAPCTGSLTRTQCLRINVAIMHARQLRRWRHESDKWRRPEERA